MTDKLISIIGNKYKLVESSAGEFEDLKVKGMRFHIKKYEAEGLGHVSLMKAKGFFGLMKMDTLIINPIYVDLPLLSYDRIIAMGNDTLIIEAYDTLEGKPDFSNVSKTVNKYNYLPKRDPGNHWYDSIKLDCSVSFKGKKMTDKFDLFSAEYFKAYLDMKAEKVNNIQYKTEKTVSYVEGLLKNGGPSTDVFKKELGEEKTRKLFEDVLFGIK